ncbi:MAG: hypothetical protein IPJ84_16045 [Bdellovibrionales bacterium]|nr:hypothetical protein [Bdellovibrionales bacterium]
MYRLRRAFILTVFLFVGAAEAQLVDIPPSKQMMDGVCVDTQGRESAARDVGSGPDADKDYLQKIPSCRSQVTCLSRERLEYLERVGMMPMGLKNPQEYFKAAAPLAARMSCYEDQANVERQVLELDDILKKSKKLMPYETMLSTEITLDLAQQGREFIKDNRAAVQALADCYQLDAEYDERKDEKLSPTAKLALYNKSDLRKRSEAPFCEPLWSGKSNIAGTLKNLKEFRQTLLALQVDEYKKSLSSKEFETLYRAMSLDQLSEDDVHRTLKPLSSIGLVSNPLYSDAPKVLMPATDDELHGLGAFHKDLAKRYPEVKMKEALLSNLNRLIEMDPMLIYFDKSRPTSADMAKAFKQYVANLKTESFEDGLSDFQFYEYPKLVDSIVKEYPPDMRGDACAVAEYVHRRSREIAGLPATMLMDVTTVAGLGGALNIPVLLKLSGAKAAKGAVGRAGAFLSAGMAPGMALMTDMAVTRGLSVKFEKDMCQSLQGQTNGMCRSAKINRDLIELQIQGAMMAAMPVVMKATSSFGAARAAKASQAEAVSSAPANTFRRHKNERKR